MGLLCSLWVSVGLEVPGADRCSRQTRGAPVLSAIRRRWPGALLGADGGPAHVQVDRKYRPCPTGLTPEHPARPPPVDRHLLSTCTSQATHNGTGEGLTPTLLDALAFELLDGGDQLRRRLPGVFLQDRGVRRRPSCCGGPGRCRGTATPFSPSFDSRYAVIHQLWPYERSPSASNSAGPAAPSSTAGTWSARSCGTGRRSSAGRPRSTRSGRTPRVPRPARSGSCCRSARSPRASSRAPAGLRRAPCGPPGSPRSGCSPASSSSAPIGSPSYRVTALAAMVQPEPVPAVHSRRHHPRLGHRDHHHRAVPRSRPVPSYAVDRALRTPSRSSGRGRARRLSTTTTHLAAPDHRDLLVVPRLPVPVRAQRRRRSRCPRPGSTRRPARTKV